MDSHNDEDAKTLGDKPEFLIRILYRDNVSWQGEIHWLDGDRKEYFRSFLELFALMQEVMEPDRRFRSFKGREKEFLEGLCRAKKFSKPQREKVL